jgi:hypothetical protein
LDRERVGSVPQKQKREKDLIMKLSKKTQSVFNALKTNNIGYLFYVSNLGTIAPREVVDEKRMIFKLFSNDIPMLRAVTMETLKDVRIAEENKDKTNTYFQLWERVKKNIRPALPYRAFVEILICAYNANLAIDGTKWGQVYSEVWDYEVERNYLYQFSEDKKG